MSVRIFSCGNNLDNLKICIKEKVIGFRRMHNDIVQGDIVYITIRMPKINHCCARAVISNITDFVPWENPELYVLCYRIENIEFCNPFSLDFLKNTSAGDAWGAIFIRGSLSIKDNDALYKLSDNFNKNIVTKFYAFKDIDINPPKGKRGRKKKGIDNSETQQNLEEESSEENEEIDDSFVEIMSTFKVVKFKNERDENYGLQKLVNNNFYKLFSHIQEQNSILISRDRMFSTKGKDGINGIIGIPDAVLISFDKNDKKSSMKINIIEYECYGEDKSTSTKKFDYLNSHIIPQLIKFASTFSIVTDVQIREDTINSWLDKIINYCDQDTLEQRIYGWLKELNPQTRESQIFDKFRKELQKAFKNNIRIMLVIDELTGEQRETIKNIINSFKLKENVKSSLCHIDFSGYVIRLEYMLNYDNTATSKYALSIQDN